MKNPIWQNFLAGGYSTVLHIVLVFLLLWSFELPNKPVKLGTGDKKDIVQAAVIAADTGAAAGGPDQTVHER